MATSGNLWGNRNHVEMSCNTVESGHGHFMHASIQAAHNANSGHQHGTRIVFWG